MSEGESMIPSYICLIERFDFQTYNYQQVFKALGGDARVTTSENSYHRPPSVGFRFYPEERKGDEENDRCMIVCEDEIWHGKVDIGIFPQIEITGYLSSLHASERVERDPDYGNSFRYTPDKNPDFKAGHVRIRIWPVGTCLGDDEFVKEFRERNKEEDND